MRVPAAPRSRLDPGGRERVRLLVRDGFRLTGKGRALRLVLRPAARQIALMILANPSRV